MSRQGDVRTIGDASAYVDRLLDPRGNREPFAITDHDQLLGLVVVTVDCTNLSGWFWYWMNASHRGRGWTTWAAASVADLAFAELGLQRLELGHRANSPASGAVARASGFIQEGVERRKFLVDGRRIDVLTYGRLDTDPQPPRRAQPQARGSPK